MARRPLLNGQHGKKDGGEPSALIGDRSNEVLNEPVFIDVEHFQVQLPTGESRVYSVFE